jgi:hypothetical protein
MLNGFETCMLFDSRKLNVLYYGDISLEEVRLDEKARNTNAESSFPLVEETDTGGRKKY